MNLLIVSLLIACLLPYFFKLPAVFVMGKLPGGYDNHHPRRQQAQLTGMGARAIAAHQNSFESLILFASAILTALATQHDSGDIQVLAIAYLVLRVAYFACYLWDYATLRTCIWTLSTLMSLSIMGACLY